MISSQGVYVCFVKNGTDTFLELVEPINEKSIIFKMQKKGITYYHVGYITDNILDEVKSLEANNYKAFDYFHSEAFNDKRCVFLISPDGHLMELIES